MRTPARPLPLENIRNALVEAGGKSEIRLDFQFIGIGLKDGGKVQLRDVASATNGTAHFAEDRSQLADQIRGLVEAVTRDARRISALLDQNAATFNPVLAAIRNDDFPTAERQLPNVTSTFARSKARFEEFGYLYPDNPRYRRFYEVAHALHDLEGQLIARVGDLLQQRRSTGNPGLSDLRQKIENLRVEYSRTQDELNVQLGQLESVVSHP